MIYFIYIYIYIYIYICYIFIYLLNLDLSNICSHFVFFDRHSDYCGIVVVGGSNYNYNYNDLIKIGFIIYYMYNQKSNTTLGLKFYCQLAPSM